MAMLLDSVAPLVNMISLGSAPIRSAICCKREHVISLQGVSVGKWISSESQTVCCASQDNSSSLDKLNCICYMSSMYRILQRLMSLAMSNKVAF